MVVARHEWLAGATADAICMCIVDADGHLSATAPIDAVTLLSERGVAAAEAFNSEVVYAGFSMGVMVAQQLAQTRPGARGAVLMYSCLPASEFGSGWPEGVPVQVHGKEADPFFAEDLEAAQALVDSTDRAELFLYRGEEHLFADSSLPAYDAAAAALLTERVLAFLGGLEADNTPSD
jgi:dienelactone hydrolase